ncbi:PREDICTED: TMV resistance protein N-like [Prunus mume]|uniref:TMV resistance protein N-like n=1 Tax=Prunus mume TaxID=102107 RepID=A0ABM1LSS3_PRUMU|nr:PREDICTED: TMV resistance protein N-like [Prunus mume]
MALITSESVSSSSSSSSSTNYWRNDVFISYRGADTRYNFTDHLYSNLQQKGIKTFMDTDYKRGEELGPGLLNEIEESKISIIVFSENFGSSSWCLEELVHILRCKRSRQQMVLPIFYKVEPSDVRKQVGTFGEAFVYHERKFSNDTEKVTRWRKALTEAANLHGWLLKDGSESKLINDIVEEISLQVLNHTYLHVAKYPVGIESRLQYMGELLGVGVNDVRMVGIWGIRGIGKTTIAKAVYNSIAHQFEGSCFLENVRENSAAPRGLLQLQKTLLYEILGGKELEVTSVDKGINVIKQRLSHKKVLLMFDDVDQLDQLNKLVGRSDWLGLGSRIIITTRHKHLLTSHQVDLTYEVKELDTYEASELFSYHAFPEKGLPDDYKNLAVSLVDYAKGIPLALTVTGSLLCGRSVDEWQAVLDCYRRAPALDTDEILQITKYALEHPEVSMETAPVRIEEEHVLMHDLQEEMHIETAQQDVREDVNIGTIGIQRQESLPEQPDEIRSSAKSFVSKVFSAEWMFLIVSLMLEIFSAICDQLSSPRKPLYALFGMGLAIMALATCIWEFIHKGRRGNVQFGKCGILLWWFYCPSSGTLFGTFPEICGLIYAITQWASSMVQFVCVLRHKDNPFKVNIFTQLV